MEWLRNFLIQEPLSIAIPVVIIVSIFAYAAHRAHLKHIARIREINERYIQQAVPRSDS